MRIGLFGSSGSGKTYSALRLAKGLVGDYAKICVIDTEQGSADLYSHLGDYSVLTLDKFSPQSYVAAIQQVDAIPEIECIIIDSISHEWEGVGGCLDIHSKLGGRFETWAKVTPMHNVFISSILNSKKHVIATARSKIDYDMGKDEKSGKAKIEKVGLKTISREGFDYEMTMAFRISHSHLASVDKDRSGIFDDVPFLITEETGKKIREWNDAGAAVQVDLTKEVLHAMYRATRGWQDKAMLEKIIKRYGSKEDLIAKSDEEKKDILDHFATGAYLDEIEV